MQYHGCQRRVSERKDQSIVSNVSDNSSKCYKKMYVPGTAPRTLLINFNNTFYLIKYFQNIIISVSNQYKKLQSRFLFYVFKNWYIF